MFAEYEDGLSMPGGSFLVNYGGVYGKTEMDQAETTWAILSKFLLLCKTLCVCGTFVVYSISKKALHGSFISYNIKWCVEDHS